jgi:hypothetical protein
VEWLAAALAACEMSAKGEALMFLSPRKIGSVLLMLVLAHLFAPAAHALPPSDRQGVFRYGDVFTAAWEWLGSMLLPAREKPGSRSAWGKAGSQMDLDGMFQGNGLSPEACEAGSQMDPDGFK